VNGRRTLCPAIFHLSKTTKMHPISARKLFRLAVLSAALACCHAFAENSIDSNQLGLSAFDAQPEPVYVGGPGSTAVLPSAAGTGYVAYRPAPLSSTVAVIEKVQGAQKVVYWTPGQAPREAWDIPSGTELSDVEWLPDEKALVFLGKLDGRWTVFRQERGTSAWSPKVLASSRVPLKNIIVSTRRIRSAENEKTPPYYRVFFGAEMHPGKYETRSVRESGDRLYTLISEAPTKETAAVPNTERVVPSHIHAKSALPVGYAQAGDTLDFADEKHCIQEIWHDEWDWETTPKGLAGAKGVCGGHIQLLPNGTGLLQWQAARPGVKAHFRYNAPPLTVADGTSFSAQPLLTADGKALFGVVGSGDAASLVYQPVSIPLADVTNAWMFLEEHSAKSVSQHLSKDGGLLTPAPYDQIYALYDSERYDREDSQPRPYMVTTDEYWELFAVAHEGTFIVTEQQVAIPAFWNMVKAAVTEADSSGNHSRFANAFRVLDKLKAGERSSAEVARILESAGLLHSDVLDDDFDFSELVPRGHYTGTTELQLYFRAMRYLTHLPVGSDDARYLASLPESVQAQAKTWISAYLPYIAPPRAAGVWKGEDAPLATYGKHLQMGNSPEWSIFPLSWGFDNEILNRTVYHPEWPDAEQIRQDLSSGLALASVMGSPFADSLRARTVQQTPHLGDVLSALKSEYRKQRNEPQLAKNLYNQWLEALGTQWAASPRFPGEPRDSSVWQAKMLQTGLASWATLRHTTLLVNDESGAEGGEGGIGFESILQKPPRGYVEPSPEVWLAIAHLYDSLLAGFDTSSQSWAGADAASLKKGYREKLVLARDHARSFARIAAAERAGKNLSSADYVEILNTGAVVDHLFSEFRSVMPRDHQEYAVANPEPMSKIADVQDTFGKRLYVAVGKPSEWDQVVPFYGRHELVKGAVYSFREFVDDKILTDEDWRKQEVSVKPPAWLAPYQVDNVYTQQPPVQP
jgi:hypothetical protein